MDEKSLELLEFPKVLQILAGFTSFSASRELAFKLKPSPEPGLVSGLMTQSHDARYLLSLKSGFSIGCVLDIRDVVRKAAVGQIMAPQDLLDVQFTLESVRQLRTHLEELKEEVPVTVEIC